MAPGKKLHFWYKNLVQVIGGVSCENMLITHRLDQLWQEKKDIDWHLLSNYARNYNSGNDKDSKYFLVNKYQQESRVLKEIEAVDVEEAKQQALPQANDGDSKVSGSDSNDSGIDKEDGG